MYRDIVSKEELAELLAHREEQVQVPEEQRKKPDDETAIQKSMVIQYLQDTVQKLIREVSDLREQVAKLEGLQGKNLSEGQNDHAAGHAARAAAQPDAGSGITMSRTERHRLKRGKWF